MIDKTGKLVIPFEDNIAGTGFTNGISVFSKKTDGNFTYGVMDNTGKVIIPPIYTSINSGNNGPFIFGYIWTEDEHGKWGFIILNHDAADIKP